MSHAVETSHLWGVTCLSSHGPIIALTLDMRKAFELFELGKNKAAVASMLGLEDCTVRELHERWNTARQRLQYPETWQGPVQYPPAR